MAMVGEGVTVCLAVLPSQRPELCFSVTHLERSSGPSVNTQGLERRSRSAGFNLATPRGQKRGT